MIILRYSDPPETEKEAKARKDSNGPEPLDNYDISSYVTKVTWSGDSDQAARKLDFSIAYNTYDKDKTFQPLNLKLGGFIYMFYQETAAEPEMEVFEGRIFYRKRTSGRYSFDFTCYDDLIYLAKSQMRMVIKGTVAEGIKQVCHEINIPVGTLPDSLTASVDLLVDGKSGTEAIRMLLDQQQTADKAAGKESAYLPVCLQGKINVVAKGELIEGYTASADTNVISADHSESIQDLVDRVKAVDDNGTVCQMFTINDDVTHFGMIQKIYKMQPPKKDSTVDNTASAKAVLSQQKDESSLKGIGSIQCITGYSILVQEEQLQGTFYIKSDSHQFENGQHMMHLTLEYTPDEQEQPEIEQADYAQPVFKSSSGKMKGKRGTGNGSANVDAGLSAGWDAWGGTTMDNGPEGCAEFAGKCGSYYSPFLAQECDNGVVGVEGMVSDADSAGLLSYDTSDLQKGDVLVYGDNDHVVIYDGQGGYYGNSSSQNVTVHGGDYTEMDGMQVTKVIKASRG